MDLNEIEEIDTAMHEIQQMIEVSLRSAELLHGSGEDKGIFQMPARDAELLCFSLFDIEKRVKAARAMLFPESPSRQEHAVLTIVRDPA
jgi:hypothetical protein